MNDAFSKGHRNEMTTEQAALRFHGAFTNDDDLQQAVADVETDPDWTVLWEEREDDWLKCHLIHNATRTDIEVAQERQADGTWLSRV